MRRLWIFPAVLPRLAWLAPWTRIVCLCNGVRVLVESMGLLFVAPAIGIDGYMFVNVCVCMYQFQYAYESVLACANQFIPSNKRLSSVNTTNEQ